MAAAKPIAFSQLPIHAFATGEAFASWLEKNEDRVPAIAVRIGKKGSGIASIDYRQALDVALCFGWIDGQMKSEGEATYLQRFGKRKPQSLWSKVNRANVERLIAEGKMRAAGLAEIERAQADGRWDAAYASPSAATVPQDLSTALEKKPRAKAFFATLDAQNRYAIVHRIEIAKKPETRARRVATFVQMLAREEKPHS